ncbi:MAG: glycerol-3-phosphate responsive antiterminator [Dethiobacteria bacterium]|jgi:glycerol uptake operon antiterminator|nr:glycerol-3-phosphate responsive antiterminator [Bacillota bacterium]HOA35453.1 glycerol-3-phosphate responsive antiterminator [Bacillota bacterium]HOL16374.1 glycerol-3-phosphate responsive antiterminator [Bacillota bacterium]HQE09983.1 glycerol-3-phosphate responsive antiterminator [Bacillota bacterium]
MQDRLHRIIENHPVIPALKDDRGLQAVLNSDFQIVFILYGSISDIGEITEKVKRSGKMAFVNVDLIEGFANKEIVIQYMKKYTAAEGILSGKASMIKAAREQGFYTVHRLFVIDSFSFDNLDRQIEISRPDYLEILPGWPKLVTWVMEKTDIPIISGGLICCKEDAIAALKAGAVAVCSTNPEVWSA